MTRSLCSGLLAATLGLAPLAAAGSPVDTLAARLTAQDLFVTTEDAAGLDAFRPDGENWHDFDILFAAVVADGNLLAAVTDPATAVTLMAPTDEAFRNLAFDLTGFVFLTEQGVLNAITSAVAAGAVDLTNVLTYHVIPGRFDLVDVPPITRIPTLNGEAILFQPRLSGLIVEVKDTVREFRNPLLVTTDLDAGNSVVHSIDRVLIPSNVGG